MSVLPSFGYMLEAYRRSRALTHEQLAARVSCPAETLQRIEAGNLRPGRSLAERLAAQLAIPIEERPLFIKAARAETSDAPVPASHDRATNPTSVHPRTCIVSTADLPQGADLVREQLAQGAELRKCVDAWLKWRQPKRIAGAPRRSLRKV